VQAIPDLTNRETDGEGKQNYSITQRQKKEENPSSSTEDIADMVFDRKLDQATES
jgi:hypothetical protein